MGAEHYFILDLTLSRGYYLATFKWPLLRCANLVFVANKDPGWVRM